MYQKKTSIKFQGLIITIFPPPQTNQWIWWMMAPSDLTSELQRWRKNPPEPSPRHGSKRFPSPAKVWSCKSWTTKYNQHHKNGATEVSWRVGKLATIGFAGTFRSWVGASWSLQPLELSSPAQLLLNASDFHRAWQPLSGLMMKVCFFTLVNLRAEAKSGIWNLYK